MRDDFFPEDALLRPLYEAEPPESLWQRATVRTGARRRLRGPWVSADPARRRPYRPLAVALGVALLAGGGGAIVGVHALHAHRAGTAASSSACNDTVSASRSSSAVSSGAQAAKSHPPDPDAGLSDSQIQARQKQAGLDFDQHYRTWLKSLGLDEIDVHSSAAIELHSLSRSYLLEDAVTGQPTLRDAVAKADVIVVGCIEKIDPSLMATSTTIAVDQTLKGPSASNVVVMQSGGVRPTQGWAGFTLVQGADGPLLLPGDRAVLFLWKTDSGYAIQSMSGWYQVVRDLVHPAPGNSWGALVEGNTEAQFVHMVKDAMR